uniref:Kelch domain-containing protein family protein n=1 Tax=Wuchereria bancrofti TaxID=6293 RepID=A0A1I8EMU0_WUCBA
RTALHDNLIIILEGGPVASNQCAVAIGKKIYSVGDYFPPSNCEPNAKLFGISILNTDHYRWHQIAVPYRNNIYVPSKYYNRTYHPLSLSLEPDDPLIAVGEIPNRSLGHTVVAYERKIFMWGGFQASRGINHQLFCYDTEKHIWTIVSCTNTPPPSRFGHTAVVYNDMMIIFGGIDENFLAPEHIDVFNFKSQKWIKWSVTGKLPEIRDSHTSCVIGNKMYIFGGTDVPMYELQISVLNLETHHWEQQNVTGVYRDKMYIFGGCLQDESYHFGTIYEFDPKTSVWRRLKPSGLVGPCDRQEQQVAVIGNRVFMFGGLTSYNNLPNSFLRIADLHVLDYDWKLKDLAIMTLLYQKVFDISVCYRILPHDLKFEVSMRSLQNPIM